MHTMAGTPSPKTLIADAIAHSEDADSDLTIGEAGVPMLTKRRDPISITRQVISELAMLPRVMVETWASEVRQVALAAAAHGDFKSAITGYEQLGKHLGVLTEATKTEQHLHLHNTTPEMLREAPSDELRARLDAIRQKQAAQAAQAQAGSEADTELESLMA